MELNTAIEILEDYQEWRKGKREDFIHNLREISEAMDTVIEYVKKSKAWVETK